MPGAGLSESSRRGCEPWLFLVSGERRAAGSRLCLAGGWSAVRDSDGQFFDARTDRGEAAGDQGGLRPAGGAGPGQLPVPAGPAAVKPLTADCQEIFQPNWGHPPARQKCKPTESATCGISSIEVRANPTASGRAGERTNKARKVRGYSMEDKQKIMPGVIAAVWVIVCLGFITGFAAQLPPEILVDKYLLQATILSEEKDHKDALEAMDKIVALQKKHDLTLPEAFSFQYAQIALAAGSAQAAIASARIRPYLTLCGGWSRPGGEDARWPHSPGSSGSQQRESGRDRRCWLPEPGWRRRDKYGQTPLHFAASGKQESGRDRGPTGGRSQSGGEAGISNHATCIW